MTELDDLRTRIDALDQGIVEAVAERQRVVDEVVKRKALSALLDVRDPVREEAILTRLSELGRKLGLSGHFVRRLFREIIDYSLRSQQRYLIDQRNPGPVGRKLLIGFQGSEGAYSQIAAEQ